MKNVTRWGIVCLWLGVLCNSACFAPERVPAVGRVVPDDVWATPDDDRSNRVPDAISRRIRAKDLLVEELAEGRRSLVEVAALFRELDRTPPATVYPTTPDPDPPLRLPAPTDDERSYVRVISFARNSLRVTQPDRAEAVTARLVAETEAERCLTGAIRLPASGALKSAHVAK